MSKWLIIILGSLYVLAMWGVLFYIIRRGLGPYLRSKRSPKVTVKARIKNRIDHKDFHSLNWEVQSVRRVIVFECEDGIEREYDVPDDIWHYSDQDDEGELTYQGYLFVNFQSYRPKLNLDKAYEGLMRK